MADTDLIHEKMCRDESPKRFWRKYFFFQLFLCDNFFLYCLIFQGFGTCICILTHLYTYVGESLTNEHINEFLNHGCCLDFVNLTQIRIIYKEGTSIKEVPPADWHVGKSWGSIKSVSNVLPLSLTSRFLPQVPGMIFLHGIIQAISWNQPFPPQVSL